MEENTMFKVKLMKVTLMGACLSLLTAVPAFAASTDGVAQDSVILEQTVENKELLDKQLEIDKYVFEDHAADFEEKGFSVTYTGIVGDTIEIGIFPYEETYADYVYGIFGKDIITVVEGQKTIFFTGAPASPDTPAEDLAAYSGMAEGETSETVAEDIANDSVTEDVVNESVTAEDEVKIQITSVTEESAVQEAAAQDANTSEAESNLSVIWYAVGAIGVLAAVGLIIRNKR
jgi:hypothetical protein